MSTMWRIIIIDAQRWFASRGVQTLLAILVAAAILLTFGAAQDGFLADYAFFAMTLLPLALGPASAARAAAEETRGHARLAWLTGHPPHLRTFGTLLGGIGWALAFIVPVALLGWTLGSQIGSPGVRTAAISAGFGFALAVLSVQVGQLAGHHAGSTMKAVALSTGLMLLWVWGAALTQGPSGTWASWSPVAWAYVGTTAIDTAAAGLSTSFAVASTVLLVASVLFAHRSTHSSSDRRPRLLAVAAMLLVPGAVGMVAPGPSEDATADNFQPLVLRGNDTVVELNVYSAPDGRTVNVTATLLAADKGTRVHLASLVMAQNEILASPVQLGPFTLEAERSLRDQQGLLGAGLEVWGQQRRMQVWLDDPSIGGVEVFNFNVEGDLGPFQGSQAAILHPPELDARPVALATFLGVVPLVIGGLVMTTRWRR